MHSQLKGLLTPHRGRCKRSPRAGKEVGETADLTHFIPIAVSLLTRKHPSSTRTSLGAQMFSLSSLPGFAEDYLGGSLPISGPQCSHLHDEGSRPSAG